MLLLSKDLALSLAGSLLALAALGGCGHQEPIARYTVTKPEIVDPTLVSRSAAAAASQAQTRTLGLIVPVGDIGWFFKLTGDAEAVQAADEAFLTFVMSLKVGSGAEGKPSWTLPAGWQESPGNDIRYATIRIPGEPKPLEISVTRLPIATNDLKQYVLDNVNRWRGQLKLKPIAAAELSGTTKTLEIDGHEATLVSLLGTGSGGMGGGPVAPFAGGALPPDHPPITK